MEASPHFGGAPPFLPTADVVSVSFLFPTRAPVAASHFSPPTNKTFFVLAFFLRVFSGKVSISQGPPVLSLPIKIRGRLFFTQLSPKSLPCKSSPCSSLRWRPPYSGDSPFFFTSRFYADAVFGPPGKRIPVNSDPPPEGLIFFPRPAHLLPILPAGPNLIEGFTSPRSN